MIRAKIDVSHIIRPVINIALTLEEWGKKTNKDILYGSKSTQLNSTSSKTLEDIITPKTKLNSSSSKPLDNNSKITSTSSNPLDNNSKITSSSSKSSNKSKLTSTSSRL